MIPPAPTANTSFAELPHTPLSAVVVVLVCDCQPALADADVKTVPPSPTAKTRLPGPALHTALRLRTVPLVWVAQVLPPRRATSPLSPTAIASLGPLLVTAVYPPHTEQARKSVEAHVCPL